MSRTQEREFLIARKHQVEALLSACPPSEWLEHESLTAQLRDLELQIEAFPSQADVARPAEADVFFEGAPVESTRGIQAAFAPKAIESFREMVDARLAQIEKRQPKNARPFFLPKPLMIVGVARGSFGFQFQEGGSFDPQRLLGDSYTQEAIREVMAMIETFRSAKEEELAERVKTMDRRSIHAVSEFIDHVVESQATFRIEMDSGAINLNRSEVLLVAERAKRASQEIDTIEVRGRLTGLMIHARRFEFEPIEGKSFSGGFPEDTDPETFAGFLKMKCVGTFVRHREIKLGTGHKPRWKWDLQFLVAFPEKEPEDRE